MRNTHRILLAAASCLILAACAGADGKDGTNGTNGTNGVNGVNGVNGANGTNGTNAYLITNFATLTDLEKTQVDFSIAVNSVSNDAKPVVRFTVTDNKGLPVKGIGFANFGSIGLLQLVPGNIAAGGNGLGNDTWVSHMSNCTAKVTSGCSASTESATAANLVDNGDGTYTYTFLKDVKSPIAYTGGTTNAGVAFDEAAVHRLGLRLGASGNPYRPVDVVYDYIPATGAVVTGQNNKVETANCLKCHVLWRANAANAGGAIAFHSGQRYEAQYCVVCHNGQRKYSGGVAVDGGAPGETFVLAEPPVIDAGVLGNNPGRTNISVFRGQAMIDIPVFAHKIHMGKDLTYTGNYTGGNIFPEVGYAQDIRNCDTCHVGAAQADNWKNKPSQRACGACHDAVDFTKPHGPANVAPAQADDTQCKVCHTAAVITTQHLPVAIPDPNSTKSGGTNANTNASWLGNPTKAPAGARIIKYDLNAVTTVDAGVDGYVNPVVKFRFLEGDAGVTFNTYDGGAAWEIMDGFVGAPSVYCVYALPQDGKTDPADFNGSVSVYLKNALKGTGAVVTGPTGGYYTATLTAQKLPTALTKMLTCGLGYSYSLSSTPPLVQTGLTDYPYNTTTGVGGLSIPAQNVWRVATGFTGRRNATSSSSNTGQIVLTSKCADCHDAVLGNTPSYHAGQRNDAASCSWCHTSNRTSSGWSAGSESFVHGIHSAGVRNVPFNWHATSLTEGFYETTYPGRLQYCESCHQAGYFDFSNSWYSDANVQRRLYQTVATGAIAPNAIAVSPYVLTDGTNYGAGFTTPLDAGIVWPVDGAGTNLVISPIANVCFSCHDGNDAQTHFRLNGGSIYQPRSAALPTTEACLICHGPGKLAGIKDMHYK